MSNIATLNDFSAQRADCEAQLQALAQRTASVTFACLGTVDGRLWASVIPSGTSEPQGLAAMTSSLLGLCESFAREAMRSRCLYNILSTDHGVVVTVRVPCQSRRFVLSVGTDSAETVAMALRQALDTAQTLAERLDADHVAATPLPLQRAG